MAGRSPKTLDILQSVFDLMIYFLQYVFDSPFIILASLALSVYALNALRSLL